MKEYKYPISMFLSESRLKLLPVNFLFKTNLPLTEDLLEDIKKVFDIEEYDKPWKISVYIINNEPLINYLKSKVTNLECYMGFVDPNTKEEYYFKKDSNNAL